MENGAALRLALQSLKLAIFLRQRIVRIVGRLLQGGDLESKLIDQTHTVSCANIEVQGDQIVVFEVALLADYWIDDGSITVDFDGFNADHEVMCPALIVELLTQPIGATVA